MAVSVIVPCCKQDPHLEVRDKLGRATTVERAILFLLLYTGHIEDTSSKRRRKDQQGMYHDLKHIS